jgi:hypothetical protein
VASRGGLGIQPAIVRPLEAEAAERARAALALLYRDHLEQQRRTVDTTAAESVTATDPSDGDA